MNYTDLKCIYCKGKGVVQPNVDLLLCDWCLGCGLYSVNPVEPEPDHIKNPVIEEPSYDLDGVTGASEVDEPIVESKVLINKKRTVKKKKVN